jgi:hypothetical protein
MARSVYLQKHITAYIPTQSVTICSACGSLGVVSREKPATGCLRWLSYWRWPEYHDWLRLAELQEKEQEYFSEAIAAFEIADKLGPESTLAAILHYTKELRDSEHDAA